MKTINIKNGPQSVPAILLGCMRMPALSVSDAQKTICAAYDLGINFFDNATCYTLGEAEKRFGDAFASSGIKRENVIIQTKCGIEKKTNQFDWRKETIISCVEDSLHRNHES